MVTVHEFLKNAILIYLFFCAVWGLYGAARHRPVTDSYRATLLIAEALFVIQAVVGLALVGDGKMPGTLLHYVYGLVGIVVLPSVIGWVGRGKERDSLWLGLICVFLVGVALRAWTTGRPVG